MGGIKKFQADVRRAVADYMQSEGCECCQDKDAHRFHTERLAKLLHVPKYDDGSGYNFARYKTKPLKAPL